MFIIITNRYYDVYDLIAKVVFKNIWSVFHIFHLAVIPIFIIITIWCLDVDNFSLTRIPDVPDWGVHHLRKWGDENRQIQSEGGPAGPRVVIQIKDPGSIKFSPSF